MCEDIVGKEVMMVVDEISPYLTGRDRLFQNKVLAELVALWLAGHLVAEDRTRCYRTHRTLVRELTRLKVKMNDPSTPRPH